MTSLPVYSGPPKRDIIQVAFEECGQAGYEFELTAEEYGSALRRLDGLMNMLLGVYSVDLGYAFPVIGAPVSIDDESGIPLQAVQPVGQLLARGIMRGIGKQVSGGQIGSQALSILVAQYQANPVMNFGRDTPEGSGNRWSRTYFPTPAPANEP